MTDIKTLDLDQLLNFVSQMKWEKYRAIQIYQWLWQKNVESFDQMTNLSKTIRAQLAEQFYISRLKLGQIQTSNDGATKFTLELEDQNVIEAVLIIEQNRRTICVSTQVGCALGCRFCATARMGFIRNLRWHEIVEQIQAIINYTEISPTNIVFMGMGEPFMNTDEVFRAIVAINSDYGLRIGARRITVSTAGIPEGIKKLAALSIQVRLAISLNATTDSLRSKLMPINNRYPLNQLLATAHEYTITTGRRLTFEYVLLDGINNLIADAERLIKMLRNIPCKINLIPFNSFPGADFSPPHPDNVSKFAKLLFPHLPAVTIRKSRGSQVLAGCGQLASRFQNCDQQ
ncbi:MAG: 23S rRNA (adenine(2503)-C(2))-methyltransferase RlmN [candidate division WOR-3 bacterium]